LKVTRELDFVIPGALETRTGGYVYDRRMVQGLRTLGWAVNVHELDPGFPHPSADALDEAGRVFERIPSGRPVVIDGLALGGMAALAERFASRLRLIALIHHPLALETGLEPATAERLRRCERRGLAAACRVITTSSRTALALAEHGTSPEHISVVCPGTDPAPLARGTGDHRANLLCVATLTPRKDHALLFSALAVLRDRAWRLNCVGSTVRAPGTADSLRCQIDASGLRDRILLAGEVSDTALSTFYEEADVFVLASQYEGYGMVLSEALARGLPIVATRAGAIPETVPADAGLLVPAGDRGALTAALGRIMDDHRLRARLAQGARRARRRLPSWPESVEQFAAAVGNAGPA